MQGLQVKPGDLVGLNHWRWIGKVFIVYRIDRHSGPLVDQCLVFDEKNELFIFDLERVYTVPRHGVK